MENLSFRTERSEGLNITISIEMARNMGSFMESFQSKNDRLFSAYRSQRDKNI